MTTQQLLQQIQSKKSFLCIGLDVDLNKIPKHLLETEDPIFEFNKAIIDATHDLCVSYKPNTAFYEAYGIKGWQSLEKTINYINENYPISLPESEEYDTLGGLITYRLERIPTKNTALELSNDIRIVIEEVSERRIEKVRLFIR